ncbi:lysophospholipid acyltransferase family protein [Tsukamurella soli]|uniref:Lysophospholipid acyltransferase family protein n=1 Tax=Tsukamurella soli TaxID=644556 RepID=A0ABP8JU27_9ACTN
MRREPVFDVVTALVRGIVRVQGLHVRMEGVDNIPAAGGVVLAVNHTSYVDFMDVGLIARKAGRYPRYMMKAELRENRVVGFLMKHCRAIGVDRSHGSESFHEAVDALRAGELVVVYPEATISRSFELKQFKSGAARMALDSGAQIVPLAIWGAQRIWTKDIPKALGRRGFEIVIVAGPPLEADGDADALTARIRTAMQECLDRAQAGYPAPVGAGWVPRRLGGSAPTLDEALVLEDKEMAERRARKAARGR